MMKPEPSPPRGWPPSSPPWPPGPPGPGMKRRKNSSIGSSSCPWAPGPPPPGAPPGLRVGPFFACLFTVMTFTTAGPSIFMSGVKSGSGTTSRFGACAGWGALAPEEAPCASTSGGLSGFAAADLLPSRASQPANSAAQAAPTMRIFMDVSWREHHGSQFTCRLGAWLLIAALACALPIAAGAQELVLGAGAVGSEGETSHGYSLAYFHRLRGPLLGSFTYLNEGHLGDHHRDGFGAQLWLEAGGAESRFSLAAGAGPYRYFDSVRASSMDGFEDHSGWAALYSLAATWRPSGRWFAQLRFNRVIVRDGPNTSTLMAGLGFRLDAE